jgi:hypothetical protein
LKKILYLVIIICIFVACLSFGGYTLEQFANEIHLRNPSTVLSPITSEIKNSGNNINIPQNSNGYTFDPNAKLFDDNSTQSSNIENSNNYSENSLNNTIQESNKEESTNNNQESISQNSNQESTNQDSNQESVSEEVKDTINSKTYKFTVGKKTFELNKNTVANFVKWISDNVKNNEKISYVTNTIKDKLNQNSIESSAEQSSSKEESKVQEVTEENSKENSKEESKESSIEESVNESSVESKIKVYGTTLLEIERLYSSITIIKELPEYNDYNRNTFENPVKSYKLNGNTANRNDYAWKTSKYFNEQDFTYTCPYTGKIIKDMDDKKEDQDFGNLDYDHIVALKSAYLRGAKDWTEEQRNEYAYNQFVGVDVLNSANRSKSDKGPAEWLPDINRGSYCYSWLVICKKYNLSMTQEEIDICKNEINKAIENGESIEFMGGHYED